MGLFIVCPLLPLRACPNFHFVFIVIWLSHWMAYRLLHLQNEQVNIFYWFSFKFNEMILNRKNGLFTNKIRRRRRSWSCSPSTIEAFTAIENSSTHTKVNVIFSFFFLFRLVMFLCFAHMSFIIFLVKYWPQYISVFFFLCSFHYVARMLWFSYAHIQSSAKKNFFKFCIQVWCGFSLDSFKIFSHHFRMNSKKLCIEIEFEKRRNKKNRPSNHMHEPKRTSPFIYNIQYIKINDNDTTNSKIVLSFFFLFFFWI